MHARFFLSGQWRAEAANGHGTSNGLETKAHASYRASILLCRTPDGRRFLIFLTRWSTRPDRTRWLLRRRRFVATVKAFLAPRCLLFDMRAASKI